MPEKNAAEQEKWLENRRRLKIQQKARDKKYGERAARWEKGQKYMLRETLDADGDILWSLSGPNVGMTTHSIEMVKSFLEREGVDYGTVRFEPCVWPGAPEPNDGDA